LIATSITEYNKREVRAEISSKFAPAKEEKPAAFHAISICNLYPLNELYASNYILSKLIKIVLN
jgi:hypothetical protein